MPAVHPEEATQGLRGTQVDDLQFARCPNLEAIGASPPAKLAIFVGLERRVESMEPREHLPPDNQVAAGKIRDLTQFAGFAVLMPDSRDPRRIRRNLIMATHQVVIGLRQMSYPIRQPPPWRQAIRIQEEQKISASLTGPQVTQRRDVNALLLDQPEIHPVTIRLGNLQCPIR